MNMLSGALSMGRAQAKTRMTETVTCGPFTVSVNTETLATTRTVTSVSYAGVAQVKYPTLTVSEREAGAQQYATGHVELKVPITAPRIPINALVVVTASTVDGLLVAREYRVRAAPQSGQVTAHRYPLEELT
jgi:hypothetical protein